MGIEESSEGYKLLCDEYLSLVLYEYNQFLFEKKELEELIERYANFRSELYDLQQISEDLINQTIQMESDIIKDKETAERLKKENIELTRVFKIYNSRKVVRFSNKIHNLFSKPKKGAKKIVRKTRDINTKRKNKGSKTTNSTLNHSEKSKTDQLNLKRLKDIKVAIILDEFSYNGFKFEFNAIPLEPTDWLEVMQTEKPDLFLCESAWSGGAWQGRIQYDAETETENRAVLLHILNFCRESKIPTIFWNKEDPTNFNSFYDTALRFDHIFTTDEECVKLYRDKYGHESVHCMIFAGQPRLFNPIETHKRTEDIVFAGSWYAHHTERSREMEQIFDNILRSGYNLKIYDRFHEFSKKHPNYRFPEKYHSYLNPPVNHDQIGDIYKESNYALNINTVTKSKTMFARRVFELMLCNTMVLSNYSIGLHHLFNENIEFVEKNRIDLTTSKQKRINNLYNVLQSHTYKNRFKQILNTINYEYLADDNSVTVYYTVKGQDEVDKVIEHFNSLDYDYKKIIVVLEDGIPENIIQRYATNNVTLYSLKNLLNQVETIENNTPYFIFANLELDKEFINKAVLHYSYIDTEYGIKQGNKFIFKKIVNTENVLLGTENFRPALKNHFTDDTNEILTYVIQI